VTPTADRHCQKRTIESTPRRRARRLPAAKAGCDVWISHVVQVANCRAWSRAARVVLELTGLVAGTRRSHFEAILRVRGEPAWGQIQVGVAAIRSLPGGLRRTLATVTLIRTHTL
jgi:hypothetical protein